ncbi:MAG: hypothetical protein EU531_10700 [Promethearchaeota archaeon]|nr:MAG: hypothetical protein EU531_10700 [Candidatus Lokiarchaeota archaeon]
MATIKFDRQDELDELIARVYLDTNKKFSKKELLEIIFELGIQDYHALLNKINTMEKSDSKDLRTQFINQFSGSISVSEPDEIDPKSIWEKEVED